jgi:hypothetical protein
MIDTELSTRDYDLIRRVIERIQTEGGEISPIAIRFLKGGKGSDLLPDAIEQDLKNLDYSRAWPVGYTRGEVIERLANFWSSERDLTRDINVFEARVYAETVADAVDESEIQRPAFRLENIQEYMRYAYEMPFVEDHLARVSNEQEFINMGILKEGDKIAIPIEKAREYVYDFRGWLSRSDNIQEALRKVITGVISSEEFNKIVETYKNTEDFALKLYENEVS